MTNYTDINGKLIRINDTVRYADDTFTVEVNLFNNKLVLDNDFGQVNLEDVYKECEVIRTPYQDLIGENHEDEREPFRWDRVGDELI